MPDGVATLSGSPYPGLRPFDSDEADLFFGREAHTDRLLEILQREHFLAVVGPSGCGKSSLVRAGLLPGLKMGSLGSGSDWRIAIMRPGNQPIRSLARALVQHHLFSPAGIEPLDPRAITEDAAMLEAELRRGPLGLRHAAAGALDPGGAGPSANLLILVDQFEEIFTYAEAGLDRADESDLFVNLLLEARADPGCRLYVVLTMRTDFLGNCVRFHALPDAINRAQYLTPRLTRAEMESAIEGPAEVSAGSIEPSLVTELINATQRNQDELPLLQHALSRMWARANERERGPVRMGWDDVKAAGGLAGALNQHAESIYASVVEAIGADSAPLVERLFAAITERRTADAGGQAVRRPQRLSRIANACGLGDDWQPLVPIVEGFAAPDAGLLQHGPELNGDSVIDLAHEALIRQWTRLSAWVEAETRRRNDYLRWSERAAERATDRGGLLEGGGLARAIEWLRGDPAPGNRTWRPDAQWAARYTPADPGAFARTAAFIEESAAAEQRRLDAQREAAERERAAVVERARSAERAAAQARRQLLLVTAISVLMLLFAAGTLYFGYQARRTAARADAAARQAADAEARAQLQQARAEEALRRLDEQMGSQTAAYPPPVNAGNTAATATAPRPIPSGTAAASTPPPTGGVLLPPPPRPSTSTGSTASRPSPSQPPPAQSGGFSMAALAAVMPSSTDEARSAFFEPLRKAMAEFGIDTPLRQAHFLGQLSFESGDLRYLQERWGPTPAQQRYEPPSSLASSLGNTEPGDGQKYLGRGIFQIVGRGNYQRYGDWLGLDLVNNPALAARPDVAARLAAVFWSRNNLNTLADADDITGITRRISGGANGLETRTRAVARAKAALQPPARP